MENPVTEANSPPPKALVGLGNPGSEFIWTRHNAGFDVMDELAARLNATFDFDSELNALVARPATGNTLIVKPQTGMNDSGKTVGALVAKFNVRPLDVALVYDDVMLPMGRLKFATKGGAGGHHGIESTIRELAGDTSFTKVRVAVGPDPGGAERFKFVLSPISPELRELYLRVISTSADACQLWLSASADACMCKFNGIDLTRTNAS